MFILKVLLSFLIPGNRRVSEGTCRGDSGGPLLIDEYMNGEFTTVQNGVLHGSLQKCSNQKYPAIFSRLSHPDIHNWLFSNLFESKYWLLWEHSHIKNNMYVRASRFLMYCWTVELYFLKFHTLYSKQARKGFWPLSAI